VANLNRFLSNPPVDSSRAIRDHPGMSHPGMDGRGTLTRLGRLLRAYSREGRAAGVRLPEEDAT